MSKEPPGVVLSTREIMEWLGMNNNDQFHWFKKKHGIKNAGIKGKYLKKDIKDAKLRETENTG